MTGTLIGLGAVILAIIGLFFFAYKKGSDSKEASVAQETAENAQKVAEAIVDFAEEVSKIRDEGEDKKAAVDSMDDADLAASFGMLHSKDLGRDDRPSEAV